MRIDICICTYRRPHIVRTLRSLNHLVLPDAVRLCVIVIDNDATPSAREAVESTALRHPLIYAHHPGANISDARNAALDLAEADWIALIDDDETADPDWLHALIARQSETGADAIFGPSRAIYPHAAPRWIRRADLHTQHPQTRRGHVETGHSCNALLRWGDAPWRMERFDLTRGRTGGEDTEFFFRLHRLGATYAIARDAVVREAVSTDRLRLRWLLSRRFRAGQSYASVATTPQVRTRLFLSAAAKAFASGLVTVPALIQPHHGVRWLLRATLHAGVCAGCLGLRQRQLYGADQTDPRPVIARG